MMLNLCGRIIDDDELYEDMGDKTDKEAIVPYIVQEKEMFQVCFDDVMRDRETSSFQNILFPWWEIRLNH